MSDPAYKDSPLFAYNSPGHREYNKSFEPKVPFYDVVKAPWLSNETATNLPKVRREFNSNRDPLIPAQLKDLEKTEMQRREETQRSGKGKLKLELKPPLRTWQQEDALPPPSPYPVETAPASTWPDEASPDATWMEQERDRVMAQVPQNQNSPQPEQEIARSFARSGPSR